MRIEFTSEQAEVVIDVLQTEATDLRMEIAHTDTAQSKDDLRRRQELLASVLTALREQADVNR